MEGEKTSVEEVLSTNIDTLKSELDQVRGDLDNVTREKEEASQRCREMEEYIAKMGVEFRDTMHMVSSSIEWGKGGVLVDIGHKLIVFDISDVPATVSEAQKYSQSLVKDIVIRECQDKIKQLEKENNFHKEAIALVASIL